MSDYPISIPTNLQSILFSSKPPPSSPLYSPCSSLFRPPSLRNMNDNPKQGQNKKNTNAIMEKSFQAKPKPLKKEYLCLYCKLKFHSNFNLKRHLGLHEKSANLYVCQHCRKQFNRKDNLNSHMRICLCHKDKDKTNSFFCDFEGCGKVYPNTTLLNYHKKKHTDKIEVICGLAGCVEKFTDEKLMKKHRKLKKLHLKKLFLKEGLGEERRERKEYNKFIEGFFKQRGEK